MAKRKNKNRRSRQTTYTRRKNYVQTANRRLRLSDPLSHLSPRAKPVNTVRAGRSVTVRTTQSAPVQKKQTKNQSYGLTNADKIRKICKRRHERKEIIHAVGKSGRGGQAKPKQQTRNIKC